MPARGCSSSLAVHFSITLMSISVFSEDGNAPFVVDFPHINKYQVTNLFKELNIVKCRSLSAAGFLSNNDINLTAT